MVRTMNRMFAKFLVCGLLAGATATGIAGGASASTPHATSTTTATSTSTTTATSTSLAPAGHRVCASRERVLTEVQKSETVIEDRIASLQTAESKASAKGRKKLADSLAAQISAHGNARAARLKRLAAHATRLQTFIAHRCKT